MDLCVINAWSGGTVFGESKGSATKDYKDNMLLRSNYLSTADGKSPDIIFLNYGTNDLHSSPSSSGEGSRDSSEKKPTGNLYQRLEAANGTKTDAQVVAEWFAEVKAYAEQKGYVAGDPDTITFNQTTTSKIYTSDIYDSWEGAYALAVYNIKRLHPNAEIYIFTLGESNSSASQQPKLGMANAVLRAIAEYFGATVIEHVNSGINYDNCHTYAADYNGLHPNLPGHALITKLIVETLYEKLPK